MSDKCAELAKVCRCGKTYPSCEELIRDDSLKAVFGAVAALALDGPWMPVAFYNKLGFFVVDTAGPMQLLWKPFVTVHSAGG